MAGLLDQFNPYAAGAPSITPSRATAMDRPSLGPIPERPQFLQRPGNLKLPAGLLDGLLNATPAAPSGILGNLGAPSPNQRVAGAFDQIPPELMAMLMQQMPQPEASQSQLPPGLAQLLLGMMSPQGQAMPPMQQGQPQTYGQR